MTIAVMDVMRCSLLEDAGSLLVLDDAHWSLSSMF